jgi:ATP-binding cassette subfamily C protein
VLNKSPSLSVPPIMAEGLRACRHHFAFVALFSALVNLLYLAPTIYMMQVYDRAVPSEGRLTLLYLTLIAGFALMVLSALDALRGRLLLLVGLRLERLVAPPILAQAMARGASGGPQQPVRDFDTLRQFVSGPIALALIDLPWTPIYLIVAFMIHPALGGLIIVGGVILITLALLNERATRAGLQQGAARQVQAYALQEAANRNAEVIRSLGMRGAILNRQAGERAAAQHLTAQAQMVGSGLAATTKFFRLFLQSAALGLAAWLAIERQISSGSIIAASILLSRALQPLEQIVGGWASVVQGRTAMTNLTALFEGQTQPTVSMHLPDPQGRLDVEQIILRAGEGMALNTVSFSVSAQEILGVIGPSGAGKTALARVVAGALSPDAGVVRLDGANLADWDSDRLGRFIGYLPQTSGLLAGSIRDNISRFAGGETDRAEIDRLVVEAAQAAGVHDLILHLPHGYDAVLGVGGLGLSAGQGQRIALARALYRRPSLIVLDEPNSALDSEGEEALYRAIATAKGWGATVIVVTHRLGLLAHTDRILVLREGRVAKTGPTSEFVEQAAAASSGAAPPPGGRAPRQVSTPTSPMKAAG